MSLHRRYWKLIEEVMENTKLPAEDWPTKWQEIAQSTKKWRNICRKNYKKDKQTVEKDLWINRPAEKHGFSRSIKQDVEAQMIVNANIEVDEENRIICEHCGQKFKKGKYLKHEEICSQLAPGGRRRRANSRTLTRTKESARKAKAQPAPPAPIPVPQMNPEVQWLMEGIDDIFIVPNEKEAPQAEVPRS